MKKSLHRKQCAFTLVEIMIVVAIIGIMVAIALPAFLRARELSRARACQENLAKIQAAIDIYAVEFKQSGDDEVTFDELVLDNGTGYLRTVPQCSMGGAYTITIVKEAPSCSIGLNAAALFAPHTI